MKQRAVGLIAYYMSHRPIGHIVGLKPIGDDDYVLAIEDVRDERAHVGSYAMGLRTVAEVGEG